MPVAEVCRKHGISNATYYQWKSKYSGVSASELKRIKDLEAENSKLKRLYAELALGNTAIKDFFTIKDPISTDKREVINSMVVDHQLSRSKACKLVGLSRSALHKPKTDWAVKDAPVVDALNEIVAVHVHTGVLGSASRVCVKMDAHGTQTCMQGLL